MTSRECLQLSLSPSHQRVAGRGSRRPSAVRHRRVVFGLHGACCVRSSCGERGDGGGEDGWLRRLLIDGKEGRGGFVDDAGSLRRLLSEGGVSGRQKRRRRLGRLRDASGLRLLLLLQRLLLLRARCWSGCCCCCCLCRCASSVLFCLLIFLFQLIRSFASQLQTSRTAIQHSNTHTHAHSKGAQRGRRGDAQSDRMERVESIGWLW